ncbi:MAG: AAA family ATPase [Roseibium sp.]
MSKIELDISRGELLRDGVANRLRPKTLAVLAELRAREGEVVSQDELRNTVWGRQHGRETGPKQCIRELRRLLGDSAQTPGFIETVGRKGYRLVGEIALVTAAAAGPARLCVGRETELARLADCAAAARRGTRGVTLVCGEAGAGKSRLVEAFAPTLPGASPFWTARGQCIPHPGAREPFGPLIEIVTQLVQGPAQGPVLRLLEEVAPSWRDLIPELRTGCSPADRPDPVVDPHPDSMLRELTALLESLSRHQPLAIIVEDLHWADQSTLAWLLSFAQRRTAARTLVLGTYRSDELDRAGDLPTTLHFLQRTPGFSRVVLEGLGQAAVAELLDRRFPGSKLPQALAGELTRRTEGHAILVDAVADLWCRDGMLKPVENHWILEREAKDLLDTISEGTRSFIAGETTRLAPRERQVLEVASVAGIRFSATLLHDCRHEVEESEKILDGLAGVRRFIERAGSMAWPDGTVATQYVFRHALYQEALYEAIPAANRQGLHERIGCRLEAAFETRPADVAATLADHFERAADRRRAAIYRGMSGLTALKRGAVTDASEQFRQALDFFAACAPDPELRTAECRTLLGLGAALSVGASFTETELRTVCERAAGLAEQTNEPTTIVPALAGLWNHHISKADLATADDLARSLGDLAEGAPALHAMVAHNVAGQTRFFGGALADCLPHIEAVCEAYDTRFCAEATVLFGEDPGIVCRQYAACVHPLLGRTEDADRHFAEGMRLAHTLDQPFGRAQMLWAGALIARDQEAPERVLERALSLIETCDSAAIPFWRPHGSMLAGWARTALGDRSGMQQLGEGLKELTEMGVKLTRPFGLELYAEAAGRCGNPSEGLTALGEALRLMRTTGERWREPELYRLWAALSLQAGRTKNVSLALRRAIALARSQNAGACERRAREFLDRHVCLAVQQPLQ